MIYRHAVVAVLVLFVAACATGPTVPAGEPCIAAAFSVTDTHQGARRGACKVVADDQVRVTILPEDDGRINDSAWFGFQLIPQRPGPATIKLRYRGGHHRYWPKMSYDGIHWQRLDTSQVHARPDRREAVLTLELDTRPVWISAQELVLPKLYDTWNRNIDASTDASLAVLGRSRMDQPIHWLDVNPDAKDVLFLVGRQHPPEVSGAFAYFSFMEALLADTGLANRFRARFRIVSIPLLNPDGVVGGNWRHNLGGVDLNRDWGPFTQPETQLVSALLDELDAKGARIRMFIDFHSTKRNLFYTQNDEFVTTPPGLVDRWLANASANLDNYPFANERRPVSEQANGKNYMYKRYGIPSVTYEVGDETNRRATQRAASVFATELMRLMLDGDF